MCSPQALKALHRLPCCNRLRPQKRRPQPNHSRYHYNPAPVVSLTAFPDARDELSIFPRKNARENEAETGSILQAIGFVWVESCPTQVLLPLVGLAADKVIRDR
ncbi:MAG: hypothetical protein ACQESR_05300 [Planctomycetota bacterium]